MASQLQAWTLGIWIKSVGVVCQRKGTWVHSFCERTCVCKTHAAQGPYRWMTVSIRSLGNERMLGYYGGVRPYTAVSPPRAGNDRGVRANWHEADGSALSQRRRSSLWVRSRTCGSRDKQPPANPDFACMPMPVVYFGSCSCYRYTAVVCFPNHAKYRRT